MTEQQHERLPASSPEHAEEDERQAGHASHDEMVRMFTGPEYSGAAAAWHNARGQLAETRRALKLLAKVGIDNAPMECLSVSIVGQQFSAKALLAAVGAEDFKMFDTRLAREDRRFNSAYLK